jgi:hypothetical protein
MTIPFAVLPVDAGQAAGQPWFGEHRIPYSTPPTAVGQNDRGDFAPVVDWPTDATPAHTG